MRRLASHTGTSWSFDFANSSFQTSQPIGRGQSVSLDVDAVWEAVRELAENDPDFQWQYRSCDLPIFIFANTKGAFSVDYYSPIYGSDDMLLSEASEGLTLLEHEIGHTFGLPDHMKPFTNPEYANCIMGNLYLGEIKFCSECQPKLIKPNYRKTLYEWIIGKGIEEIYFGWGDAYAYWDSIAHKITPPAVTWPASTEIHTEWQVRIDGNTPAATSIELFGRVSNPVVINPGSIGIVPLDIPPLESGLHETDFIVRVNGAVFGLEDVPVAGSAIKTVPTTEVFHEAVTINAKDGYIPKPPSFLIPVVAGGLAVVGLILLAEGKI